MPLMRVALACIAFSSVAWAKVALADEPTKQQCVGANKAAQDQRRSGRLRSAKEVSPVASLRPVRGRFGRTVRLDLPRSRP